MLATELARLGWSVDIFALQKSGPLLEFIDPAIGVIDGGYRFNAKGKLGKLLKLAACEIKLFRHLRRTRPDVLHAYLPLTNFMGAVAGRLAGVPMVVTSRRALGRHQERRPASRWLDYVANAMSNAITANSQAVAADMAVRDSYRLERIRVIRNGVDFSRFDGLTGGRASMRHQLRIDDGKIALVKVANLISYKGHAELLSAFARVAANNHDLMLFLVGEDRGMGPALHFQAAQLGIAGRVEFLGRRSDIPQLLAAMDIGILASHEEGSSNALLEKLAAGLSVVVTDAGGNAEAIEGMPGCWLVQSSDAEDVLARGLEEAVVQLEESRAMSGKRQALLRDRHSIASMVDAHLALYAGHA